jgi:nucleotide-binding universal stress UspA family protein
MSSLAKILLPVDFSGRCTGAVRYAEVLAARFGSEITLLHVLPPPHYEFSALEVGGSVLNELFAARSAQVRKDLESYLADELRGMTVKRVVLDGDPARKIVAYAHDEGFPLIIMPTHGYGPFRRFILGSVTAKVLHDADCPIWTGVHMEDVPPAGSISLKSIVVAVDLGEQSAKALQWGAWLASNCGAELSVIHATPSLEGRTGEYFDPEWRGHLAEQAGKEIEKLQQRAGTKAEVVVESGDAPMVVCSAAARLKAGLLVIGRGSAAGIFGRMRTNAYAIIRESPCPVASV